MKPDYQLIAFCVIAYLLGSIPFGYVIARMKGIDITRVGSGNIGATNVTRTLGKKWGAVTLILDLLKGFIPAFITARWFRDYYGFVVGFCAIAGHCWSVFMRFRGGKGVATSIGVLLGASPVVGLGFVLLWLAGFTLSRISSIGALTAASLLPIYTAAADLRLSAIIFSYVLAGLIFYTHRENLQRIRSGLEGRMKEILGREERDA